MAVMRQPVYLWMHFVCMSSLGALEWLVHSQCFFMQSPVFLTGSPELFVENSVAGRLLQGEG
jgi:hypothetical protein